MPGGPAAAKPSALVSAPPVVSVKAGGKTYSVVGVFSTDAARQHGLMSTRITADQAGVFTWGGKSTTQTFWMLDTPQALSILFVASGRVLGTAEMGTCKLSCPSYSSPGPYDTAVEALAGSFAHLTVGSPVSFG